MNNKDKIGYSIFIGNHQFQFFIKENYKEDEKIFRYAKTALGKLKIDFLEICKKNYLKDIKKCPFCKNDSKYILYFKIDREIHTIYVTNVELEQNSVGWKNYHCKLGKKLCPGSLLNPNSVEYISKSFSVSEEKARDYILSRNKSPFYKKNHQSEDEYKKFQSRSKDSYIEKYGKIEGEIRHKIFLDKVRAKNNREYLIKKHGNDGYKKISEKKATCSLSFYISKYGEEEGMKKYRDHTSKVGVRKNDFIKKYGIEKWNELQKNKLYKKSLEYFIDSLGYEEGLKKFELLRKSYSFTKIDYINKYGIEKYLDKLSSRTRFYSNEAKIFFGLLIDLLNQNSIEIRNLKWLDNEFFIWDSEYKRIYFYDFYFETLNKKIIIEYDNLFWHPKKDTESEFNNAFFIFNSIMSVDEKIEYDERKRNLAIFKGYNFIKVETNLCNLVRDRYKYEPLLNESIENIKKILYVNK